MTAFSVTPRSRAVNIVGCFAAVLALFATIGMLGLATWHDGIPHLHAGVTSASGELHDHERAPGTETDTADLMHMAAHGCLQSVDVPSQHCLATALAPAPVRWAMVSLRGVDSIRPESILRPPRG